MGGEEDHVEFRSSHNGWSGLRLFVGKERRSTGRVKRLVGLAANDGWQLSLDANKLTDEPCYAYFGGGRFKPQYEPTAG